ncbi:MAG TPA: prepilin-type cleavage/methylation domain-containing protein [Clostridia bacterium]|nr:prepilin-type cleavage/methylation domain-containing protein [Clostridia bacterium]
MKAVYEQSECKSENVPIQPSSREKHSNGFTLLELLTIVAVVSALAFLCVPAMTNTKTTGKSIRCLSNHRRLINAWQMYAYDNRDRLANNYQAFGALGGNYDPKLGPGWAAGWLDWNTSSDNTNLNLLINKQWATLSPYISKASDIFKCPADIYLSSAQRQGGMTERPRSVSMNAGVGDGNTEESPWEGGYYKHIRKMSELVYPGPGESWVLVDEHPDSINDPAFFNPLIVSEVSWFDIPATYHNGACPFSFADGHVEMHKWVASMTAPRARLVKFTNGGDLPGLLVPQTPKDKDIQWVSYRAGRLRPEAY